MRNSMSFFGIVVIAGEVAVGAISGTPAAMVTLPAAGITVPLSRGPTMIGTFSTETSLRAASTAPCSVPCVSTMTRRSFLPPRTPPLALTSSTASCWAASSAGMKFAIGPVTSMSAPSFTSSCARASVTSAIDNRIARNKAKRCV